MWFGQSRIKILNLPENQNRKFGGGSGGGGAEIEFQNLKTRRKYGEGVNLPPSAPPSPFTTSYVKIF